MCWGKLGHFSLTCQRDRLMAQMNSSFNLFLSEPTKKSTLCNAIRLNESSQARRKFDPIQYERYDQRELNPNFSDKSMADLNNVVECIIIIILGRTCENILFKCLRMSASCSFLTVWGHLGAVQITAGVLDTGGWADTSLVCSLQATEKLKWPQINKLESPGASSSGSGEPSNI